MLTILLSGHNYCGKSTIANWLKNKNYSIIECGDLLKKIMISQNYVGNTCEFNELMKDKFGQAFLYKYILREIANSNNKSPNAVIINGLRTKELFNKIKMSIPNTISVFIESNKELRYERYVKIQNDNQQPIMSKKDFEDRDSRHNTWGLEFIHEEVDFIIENNNAASEFLLKFQCNILNFLNISIRQEVSNTAKVGKNCSFFGHVIIKDNVIIEDNVVIGKAAFFERGLNPKTIICKNSIIRSGSVIYENVTIGHNTDCAHNVIVRENTSIGELCYITPNTIIKSFVKIGKNCRLGGLISDRCILKDNITSLGTLVHKYKPKTGGYAEPAPFVSNNVVIGRNAILIGNVKICPNVLIGAGTIITKDINEKGIYFNQIETKTKSNGK